MRGSCRKGGLGYERDPGCCAARGGYWASSAACAYVVACDGQLHYLSFSATADLSSFPFHPSCNSLGETQRLSTIDDHNLDTRAKEADTYHHASKYLQGHRHGLPHQLPEACQRHCKSVFSVQGANTLTALQIDVQEVGKECGGMTANAVCVEPPSRALAATLTLIVATKRLSVSRRPSRSRSRTVTEQSGPRTARRPQREQRRRRLQRRSASSRRRQMIRTRGSKGRMTRLKWSD